MRATDKAEYFSNQVVRTRRFFLPDWKERAKRSRGLRLVGGGCEWCAPDFEVRREGFPYLAFELVARGKGAVVLGGRSHELGAGHAFFFDSRTPQVIRSESSDPMVKYFFNFAEAGSQSVFQELGLTPGVVMRVMDVARVEALLEEAIDHALKNSDIGLRAAEAALEHALVLCAESRQPASRAIDPAQMTYLRCRGHLLRNYPLLGSIEQAARNCRVSAAYLTRLFKRFDDETPLALLTRLKMSQAAILLRQPQAQVKAVAAELGFKSAAHFSRVYRRYHGHPPSQTDP
jgi:AraC family transcriptional regulator, arabinose operon regulatory protein